MLTVSPHGPEYEHLRKWLKEARKASGLSIRELGDRLGVHHSIVGKIESSDRKLELFEFINYCEALNVNPSSYIEIITSACNKTSQ